MYHLCKTKSFLVFITVSFIIFLGVTPKCCYSPLKNKTTKNSITNLKGTTSPEIQKLALEVIAPKKLPETIDLIIVPEKEEWLVASITPVIARLRRCGMNPILIVSSGLWKPRNLDFLRCMAAQQSLVVAPSPENYFVKMLPPFRYHVLPTGSNPTDAGIVLMKTFWKSIDKVIIASQNEPTSMMLGAMLSAHRAIPFISWQGKEDLIMLFENLPMLGIKEVLFCTNLPLTQKDLSENSLHEVAFLTDNQIIRSIVESIRPENIRNIIVTREPDTFRAQYNSFWIAPYLSLLRNSLVLINNTNEATEVEERVASLIARHSLSPKNITLLGDHETIGEILLYDEGIYDNEKISIEPCSLDSEKEIAVFGVGRIPFNQLAEASDLIARTQLCERLSVKQKPSVLMIANPDTEYSDLPLCETICRLTAEEFKNRKIPIDEFYGKEAGDPLLLDSAVKAALIIFEGHIYDMTLFDRASDCFAIREDFDPSNVQYDPQSLLDNHGDSMEDSYVEEELDASIIPVLMERNLEGQPLVILQSCHSFEEEIPDRIFSIGGSGVIGSVSNIHSASGAAFIKAFCDGLLYRGDTVGEALRDARNYFLCLTQLKEKRGHKEQGKVLRVAYSFRLWGDPEMKMGFDRAGNTRRPTISAQWTDSKEITILTPHRTLPRVETLCYSARIFPQSQTAGIVKSLKNNPDQRKIMPLYFFRLPHPPGFHITDTTTLKTGEGEAARSSFLNDPLNRSLYMLYFPSETLSDSTISVRLED
ncbi:MAG: hypothetical protein ACMUIP_06205 [bacterium]